MNSLIDACNTCIKKCHELKEYCKNCSDQCTSKHPLDHKCIQFIQKFQNEFIPLLQNCVTQFNEHTKSCTQKECKRAVKEALKNCEALLELGQDYSRICEKPSSECDNICKKSMVLFDECGSACTKYIENSCDLIVSRKSKMVYKGK